ncbi:hypothetical protein KFE25_004774 [Diacronema lutheri]|uniref:DHHA2 domain-containing protein n=2 Tax=Diacronema lutheri TaxID=2081491 RepID=A0A8J5XAB2_DIALT|nr:hypothetical protein KFE25_004774 [Diacronema lutheri]
MPARVVAVLVIAAAAAATPAASPMQAFLADAKARLLAGPPTRAAAAVAAAAAAPPAARATRPTVVLGNTAGDLDTIVSSVVLAFCRHAAVASEAVTMATTDDGAPPPLFVPLIPFARRDFRLRQDACALFAHAGFAPDEHGAPAELLFADELTDATVALWQAAPADAPFALILTDHNALDAGTAARLRADDGAVSAIYDHHNDARRHERAAPRVIDVAAGSASSLIAELLLHPAAPSPPLAQACVLLLGAIAVDTRAFAADAHKYSHRDVHAAHALLAALARPAALPRAPPALSANGDEISRHAKWLRADAPLPPLAALGGSASLKALGKRLLDARFEVAGLSVGELLALDYKQTDGGGLRVGVAAIFIPLADLLLRAGGGGPLEEAMGRFAHERGVDVLLALTAADDRSSVRSARAEGEGEGELSGLKGAAVAPALERGDAPVRACAALAAALERAPEGLPAALLAEPLYVKQGIASAAGFGLEFALADGARHLRTSALRRSATRKTVLPAVTHLCARLALE